MYPYSKRKSIIVLITLCLLLASSAALRSQTVPLLINYQGRITDSSGDPLNATTDIKLTLFDAAVAGKELWNETHSNVDITDGLFTVVLGSITPLEHKFFAGGSVYLEIQVQGVGAFSPRERMITVPYAIRVAALDEAIGGTIESSVTVDGDLTTTENFEAGTNNDASGDNAAAIGEDNTASGDNASVLGGTENTASGDRSIVGAGSSNIASALSSGVLAGFSNGITGGSASAIVAGNNNEIEAQYGFIGSGTANSIAPSSNNCGIVSGWSNQISGGGNNQSFIGGGVGNNLSGDNCAIGGGISNQISNFAGAGASVIGGGNRNKVQAEFSVICGGTYNTVQSGTGAIVGGDSNFVSAFMSTIAGGYGNDIVSPFGHSFIGGGRHNNCEGEYSVIAGGQENSTVDDYSAILGGQGNINEGDYCVVLGGSGNEITDINADLQANLNLVFGEEVEMRGASHRAVFFDGLNPGRVGINRDSDDGGLHYPIHVGTNSQNGNGAHLTEGGFWSNTSSKELKENFTPLDQQQLFDAIESLNIEGWNYRNSDEYHIGPYAEEFVEAFKVGTIDEETGERVNSHLAAGDVAGVALAAVKELVKKSRELDSLKDRVAKLEQMLEQFATREN